MVVNDVMINAFINIYDVVFIEKDLYDFCRDNKIKICSDDNKRVKLATLWESDRRYMKNEFFTLYFPSVKIRALFKLKFE